MTAPNAFQPGDAVLVSRAQDGQGHEQATVVDAHTLLINGEQRPMVSVRFADGQFGYVRADGPDILPAAAEGDGEAASAEALGAGGHEPGDGEPGG